MLEPIRHILSRQRNILASGSKRREQILKCVGLSFEVIESQFDENLDKKLFSHPCEFVKENAKQKAIKVWNKLAESGSQTADLVLGADTVVTLDDVIFEKPKDKEDAIEILHRLSGRKHCVYTGVAIVTRPHSVSSPSDANQAGGPSCASTCSQSRDGKSSDENTLDYVVTTFHEATDVQMTEMNDAIIRAYVNTGEPMDKAGAYGIQGIGGSLVEGIKGDYFNVMGIPLHRLCKELYHMYIE